jgi:hypothetical protein
VEHSGLILDGFSFDTTQNFMQNVCSLDRWRTRNQNSFLPTKSGAV